MAKTMRTILFSLIITAVLSGCAGGAFGGFKTVEEPITEATVVRSLRWYDQANSGPTYEVSVEVPQAWVDNFVTTSNGSALVFNFINERGRKSPVFTIQALSLSQFWEQNGSFPSRYRNVKTTGNTYFVYDLPLDSYFSGLDDDTYANLAAVVPGIIETFSVTESSVVMNN